MSDRLREIRERESKATRGPWVLANGFGPCADGLMRFERLTDEEFGPTVLESGGRDVAATREDAEFIAYARVDIPYLIEEVERLRLALAAAKDLLAETERERLDARTLAKDAKDEATLAKARYEKATELLVRYKSERDEARAAIEREEEYVRVPRETMRDLIAGLRGAGEHYWANEMKRLRGDGEGVSRGKSRPE